MTFFCVQKREEKRGEKGVNKREKRKKPNR